MTGRRDVEPEHEHERGLPLPQHLGAGRPRPVGRGRAEGEGGDGVDLRRILQQRLGQPRRLRRAHPSGHQRRRRRVYAIPHGGARLPLPRRTGSAGQHGPARPADGAAVGLQQHPGVRRRQPRDHAVRRELGCSQHRTAPIIAPQPEVGPLRHHGEQQRAESVGGRPTVGGQGARYGARRGPRLRRE